MSLRGQDQLQPGEEILYRAYVTRLVPAAPCGCCWPSLWRRRLSPGSGWTVATASPAPWRRSPSPPLVGAGARLEALRPLRSNEFVLTNSPDHPQHRVLSASSPWIPGSTRSTTSSTARPSGAPAQLRRRRDRHRERDGDGRCSATSPTLWSSSAPSWPRPSSTAPQPRRLRGGPRRSLRRRAPAPAPGAFRRRPHLP